ncbi:Cation/calcium exchanger 2 [Linum grandiflorum]
MGIVNRSSIIIFLNASFLLLTSSSFFFFLTQPHSNPSNLLQSQPQITCEDFQTLTSNSKCALLKSTTTNPCVSQGYIPYLTLFYCNFQSSPVLGHTFLLLWLLILFYLLGNTASEYFCSSLEDLSTLLKLPPTIAGVTLLSLGNGAPDVFASIVSIAGKGTRDIGFNTMVGGASFVACVVVGSICFAVHGRKKNDAVRVSQSAFLRDVCFFLLVLGSLVMTLLWKEIHLWGAVGFSFMYVVYVIVVYVSSRLGRGRRSCTDTGTSISSWESGLSIPLMILMNKENVEEDRGGGVGRRRGEEEVMRWWYNLRASRQCSAMLWIVEMPLSLPRRLTIPVVCEAKWSKPMAVASVVFSPILLSTLLIAGYGSPSDRVRITVYSIGGAIGITLGATAYWTTNASHPPEGKRFLLPWLAGGFLMSVTWSYITAQELVALLVSMGYIFGISPSILGLTVLAWGNSISDLITNLTMAINGGPEGVQVAISGCYAGPIFNILFGLGLSLVGSCWESYPEPVLISSDPYLLETLGFLLAGLVWALVVLPIRGMKLDGVVGGGLLAIYLMSVTLRLAQTSGLLQFYAYNL